MKKRKSILAICLAITILLSGCSQSPQQGTSQPSTNTAPATSSTTSTTTTSSSASLNFNDNKDTWAGTQITDPNNVQKFEQLVDRMVTNLEAQGIEIIDDSESGGAISDTEVSVGTSDESSESSGTIPGLDTSSDESSSEETHTEEPSSSESTSSTPEATSSTASTSGTTNKSSKYLELDELYDVYKHLFQTDTGDDKLSFERKLELITSYLNPEEKYSSEDIYPALRDSWYAEHKTWIPARWEVLINTNTSNDNFPLAPSGIYDKDYLSSELDLIDLLGMMYTCPTDEQVLNAPKLNNWTITKGTTTSKIYNAFSSKAKEWGLEGRQIDKIINGLGTAKLPILPIVDYYTTNNSDKDAEVRKVDFEVDKTDYFNFFYTVDAKGWANTSYQRENALQIVLWQFMTKVASNVNSGTPALVAYLTNNIGSIYDEMQKIMADPTGNYTPVFDAEAIRTAESEKWYDFVLDYRDDELLKLDFSHNNSKKKLKVKWDSYQGYLSFLENNFATNSASLQEVINSKLGTTSTTIGDKTDKIDAGSTGGSTDMSAYEYMTKDLATENGDPIAWTAFVKYLHDGMLEEDADGIALYKGAWKELNSIIKIEDTSFESVFYTLQEDDEVAYSNYGVIFGSGIPATLACNSSGGKGTYDWQIQWVLSEGRIKLSELRETLLDYIVLVGAFTNTNYTNALDIALSGAINKTSYEGYAFGIDYSRGAAMLTIAKV